MHLTTTTTTTLLTLATTALSLPQAPPNQALWDTDTNNQPHYSATHALHSETYQIAFHRYHSNDCSPLTHIPSVDHLHTPHRKTFKTAFGSFNFELDDGNLRDQVQELNKCQIAVFKEDKCRGDALVLMAGFENRSMGVEEGMWCGSTEQFGFGDQGRSVRVLCVRDAGQRLPVGIVKGDFTRPK